MAVVVGAFFFIVVLVVKVKKKKFFPTSMLASGNDGSLLNSCVSVNQLLEARSPSSLTTIRLLQHRFVGVVGEQRLCDTSSSAQYLGLHEEGVRWL
jgi:hypothetical protein